MTTYTTGTAWYAANPRKGKPMTEREAGVFYRGPLGKVQHYIAKEPPAPDNPRFLGITPGPVSLTVCGTPIYGGEGHVEKEFKGKLCAACFNPARIGRNG